MTNSSPWKDPPFLIGKPSINGPFPMATLNNQRVVITLWFANTTPAYIDIMADVFSILPRVCLRQRSTALSKWPENDVVSSNNIEYDGIWTWVQKKQLVLSGKHTINELERSTVFNR